VFVEVREDEGEGNGEEDVPEDCGRRLRSLAICMRSGGGREEGGDEPRTKPGWVKAKKLLLFGSEAMITSSVSKEVVQRCCSQEFFEAKFWKARRSRDFP
jgi:hypothetical protein